MGVDWEGLARANTHPLRVAIMEAFAMDGGRTLSPKELSVELQKPLVNVNYHVVELCKKNLLRLDGQRQVRGAVEHFYRPNPNGYSKGRKGGKRRSPKR